MAYLTKPELISGLVEMLTTQRGIQSRKTWFDPFLPHALSEWYQALCHRKLSIGLAVVLQSHGQSVEIDRSKCTAHTPRVAWTFVVPKSSGGTESKTFHGEDVFAAAYGLACSLGCRVLNGQNAYSVLQARGVKIPSAPDK